MRRWRLAGALQGFTVGAANAVGREIIEEHLDLCLDAGINVEGINAEVMCLARPDALVMHCLPAYRGKEIDEETFEAHADTIFTQAENRLHTQKAIMSWLAV